jgi:integrase
MEKAFKCRERNGGSISVRRRQTLGERRFTLFHCCARFWRSTRAPIGDRWVFRGEKMLRPLDLDNCSRRDIPQFINGAWFGWHAFRRGLGTRLNEAGVDDKDIQSILRHADVSTTMAYYILPNHQRAEAGLKKLDKTLRTKYGIKA